MAKEIINRHPQVPLSGAVRKGKFVFISGQIPSDSEKGDIRQQTKQVLDKIRGLLEEVGGTPKDVVKVTVFLKNIEDFAAMNELYSRFFGDDFPARSCVRADLMSEEFLIEIEAVAILD